VVLHGAQSYQIWLVVLDEMGGYIVVGFRFFMVVILVSLVGYTAITISNHGWNLGPIFFGDMQAMTWPGAV